MNIKRPSSWHQQAQNIKKGLAHHISEDNQQDAIKIFESEIELDPTCIEAYYHLGFIKIIKARVKCMIILLQMIEIIQMVIILEEVNYLQLWKGLGRLYQVFKEFWIQILTTKLHRKGSSFQTEKRVRITLIILYNGLKLYYKENIMIQEEQDSNQTNSNIKLEKWKRETILIQIYGSLIWLIQQLSITILIVLIY